MASAILKKGSSIRFLLIFISLFLVFYYGNIAFFSLTTPGRHYIAFIDEHFNYIRGLRHFLLYISTIVVSWFGYNAINNDYQLLVAGRGIINVVYSCLGLGVMSFFAAFVIAYPSKLKRKLLFLFIGLICIQALNVLRFVLLALFGNKQSKMILDHHTIFNIIIYITIAIGLYLWVKSNENPVVGGKN